VRSHSSRRWRLKLNRLESQCVLQMPQGTASVQAPQNATLAGSPLRGTPAVTKLLQCASGCIMRSVALPATGMFHQQSDKVAKRRGQQTCTIVQPLWPLTVPDHSI
jgi:hypothetical protein